MKFWNWGPTTIWPNIECAAFFFKITPPCGLHTVYSYHRRLVCLSLLVHIYSKPRTHMSEINESSEAESLNQPWGGPGDSHHRRRIRQKRRQMPSLLLNGNGNGNAKQQRRPLPTFLSDSSSMILTFSE